MLFYIYPFLLVIYIQMYVYLPTHIYTLKINHSYWNIHYCPLFIYVQNIPPDNSKNKKVDDVLTRLKNKKINENNNTNNNDSNDDDNDNNNDIRNNKKISTPPVRKNLTMAELKRQEKMNKN